jgi:hypothetical protein
MNITFIKLLQADSVVSDGFSFKAVTSWSNIVFPLLVVIVAVTLHWKGKQGKDPLPKVSSWLDRIAMKLKFQVSQSTDLQPPVIIERILLKLRDYTYSVIDVADNSVSFKERPWRLMSNIQAARRLDGGQFEIEVSNNRISLCLHYYLDLLPLLLLVAALEIVTIYNGVYEGTIFFAVFFFIAGLIQIAVSKGAANGMLKEILGEGVLD